MVNYYKKILKKSGEIDTYIDNQYENYNKGKFCYKEQVDARYIKPVESSYIGNPLIEALPPVYNVEQILDKIEKYPMYSEEERYMDEDYRIQAITRLKEYVYIFQQHINIEKKISMVLRRGYEPKNITTPSFLKRVNLTSKLLNKKWVEDTAGALKCIFKNCDRAMSGFSVIGISGGGKSTALEQILSLYPQCIVHTMYDGAKFLFKQLTYIKIDCTANASIKGICIKFFNEVDSILGSNYIKKYGNKRNNVDTMILGMAHIVQIHALGMLIIDEIQHLAEANRGKADVLNFLVTLENELKLPIIYIGTYKAMKKVLGGDFRQARRASGIGEVEWDILEENSEWDGFIEATWQFQWTRKKTEATEEIKRLMYEKTMGITDRVIKLYIACQLQAILDGTEEVNKQTIIKVADKLMPLTRKMVDALRKRDLDKLRQFEDVNNIDIDSLVENTKLSFSERKELQEVLQSQKVKIKRKKNEVINNMLFIVLQLGIPEEKAKVLVTEVMEEYGLHKDMAFLLKELGNKLQSKGNEDITKQKTSKIKEKKKVKVETGYESFKRKNKIKNIDDDLN
ncbi:ATP-binding protein [Clostridium botulinum]|nr:ATP-binding protein [Clostridium botulinum]